MNWQPFMNNVYYISDVTQIVSLIQGALNAKLCSAKYIILNSKMESCYSGFTHKAIIRLKLLCEQHTVLTVNPKRKGLKQGDQTLHQPRGGAITFLADIYMSALVVTAKKYRQTNDYIYI